MSDFSKQHLDLVLDDEPDEIVDDGPYSEPNTFIFNQWLEEEVAKDRFIRFGYHDFESWDFVPL